LSINESHPKHSRRSRFAGKFNRGKKQSRGGNHPRDSRKTYFICTICGTSLPLSGKTHPVCPRCMIPMQKSGNGRVSSRTNTRKPIFPQQEVFDYSSKVHFKTDGHPQYIGLPRDHPDPENEEAVAKYQAKKKAKQARKHVSSSTQRKKHTHKNYRKKSTSEQPLKTLHSDQSTKAPIERSRSVPPSGKVDSKPDKTTKSTQEKIKKLETEKPIRKKPVAKKPKPPISKKSAPQKRKQTSKQPKPTSKSASGTIREEDFLGTALTPDQPVASIMNAEPATSETTNKSDKKKPDPKTSDK